MALARKKKKSSKPAAKEISTNEIRIKAEPIQNESENDNTFDLVGLPDRDLKKNLGCG